MQEPDNTHLESTNSDSFVEVPDTPTKEEPPVQYQEWEVTTDEDVARDTYSSKRMQELKDRLEPDTEQ